MGASKSSLNIDAKSDGSFEGTKVPYVKNKNKDSDSDYDDEEDDLHESVCSEMPNQN